MGTTSQKLEYLNGTKNSLKSAINNLGGAIDSNTTFRAYASELDTIYNNLPKVSDTGTNVSLSPTLKGRLGIVPKGNTYQDGTPTPYAPVEIQSATGTQKVVVSGKNLFDGEYQNAIVGSDGKYNTNNSTRTAMIKIEPNTTYFIKKYENTGIGTRLGIVESSTQLSSGESGTPIYYNETATEYSYTSGANAYYLYVYVTNNITNIPYLMVSKGNTATPYQPYQEPQEVDIELGNIELNKIGDYEDYIDGTPDNWVLYKKIGKIQVNSSKLYMVYDPNNYVFYTTTVSGIYNIDGIPICNYFAGTEPATANAAAHNKGDGKVCFRSGTTDRLYFTKYDITSVNDFKNWIDSKDIILYYVPLTPTTTPITEEPLVSQLNELYYLQSYNDTTNIDVTGNLPMRITASAIKGA